MFDVPSACWSVPIDTLLFYPVALGAIVYIVRVTFLSALRYSSLSPICPLPNAAELGRRLRERHAAQFWSQHNDQWQALTATYVPCAFKTQLFPQIKLYARAKSAVCDALVHRYRLERSPSPTRCDFNGGSLQRLLN